MSFIVCFDVIQNVCKWTERGFVMEFIVCSKVCVGLCFPPILIVYQVDTFVQSQTDRD